MHTNHSHREDVWIDHPHGQLFARVWNPPAEATGDGNPIVLFHDSLGCVDLWRSFPAALAAKTARRVAAYDRLGFGRSSERSGKPGLDFVADEAETYFPAIRERLGLERFVAFGHSVGGAMAAHCAARFPGACEALITESTQAFVEDRTVSGIIEARGQFRQEGQFARLEKYHGAKAAWVLNTWTETWLHPSFAAWSLAEVLPRVRCRVLVLHGAEDEYGSMRHPEMIAALSGGESRIEVLADTRHVPHREREQAVVELAARFLAPVAG